MNEKAINAFFEGPPKGVKDLGRPEKGNWAMNRRRFLGASLGAAATVAEPQLSIAAQRKGAVQITRARPIERLAGQTLTQLRDEYRRDLFSDFLPFMEKYVIDQQHGGFMCNADYHGRQVNQNKLSWFEGRGIWVYSFLYNNLAREQKYLNVARRSLEFILRIRPAGE